jgi:glycosyltransferase involved in cell wall biosynthesis
MKILLLVIKNQKAMHDRMYEAIAANSDCDLRWLTDEEQANLKSYFFRNVDLFSYDRIILFLRFKKEIRQARFIRSIPNLVILEHDACQNYMRSSKYRGKFSRHYQNMPWARILVSGFQVCARLREEGFDACFTPKGYDQNLLFNKNLERDIELAFIGSVKNKVYQERNKLLARLASEEGVQILQTTPGEAYSNMLNRVKYFVCADVGMGEYMAKTIEAMACGCVVIAYDQGDAENSAMGFVEFKNILFYRNLQEFRARIEWARSNPETWINMSQAGQQLVQTNHTSINCGKRIVDALRDPLREKPPSFIDRLKRYIIGTFSANV